MNLPGIAVKVLKRVLNQNTTDELNGLTFSKSKRDRVVQVVESQLDLVLFPVFDEQPLWPTRAVRVVFRLHRLAAKTFTTQRICVSLRTNV